MAVPVTVQQIYDIVTEGSVAPASVSFKTTTLESSKFVCVRDQQGDQNSIAIFDLKARSSERFKIAADAALMNPVTKVLALKAQNNLQIFNLDMKSRMKSCTLVETVVFWRWINEKTVGIVTPTAVYHWGVDGDSGDPKKIFDRDAQLAEAQILSYRVADGDTWMLLAGVAKQADGSLKGITQLYSAERSASKVLEGHAGCFCSFGSPSATLLNLAWNSPGGGKLMIMEVPTAAKPEPTYTRITVNVNFPANDFPVAMLPSDKFGILFLISRTGFLYLFDIESGGLIFTQQVTQDAIFVMTTDDSHAGVVGINTRGQVLKISINEDQIVPYVTQVLGNQDLAVKLAVRAGLPGADQLFVAKFDQCLREGRVNDAIDVAVNAPRGLLRNQATLTKLQNVPATPGQPPVLSAYFKLLLEKSSLNAIEGVELGKVVLQKPQGIEYLKKLLEDGKLQESEALGDMFYQHNEQDQALKIYFKANAHIKVVQLLVLRGDMSRVTQYCQKVNFTPDWLMLLGNVMNSSPESAITLASNLYNLDPSPVDPNRVIDMFLQRSQIKPATSYLLEVLKNNRPTEGQLQTRLLEMNLLYSPPAVADQILGQAGYSYYDKLKIAQLCEKAQLYQRSLENYAKHSRENLGDNQNAVVSIKRVIVNTQAISPEWLVNFFGELSKEDSLDCLRELLQHNARQNFKICVQVATKYSEELTPESLIKIFLEFHLYEALYYYLGAIVNFSQDPEVHFRYIEAAAKVGQFSEVERVTRESSHYDAERTKNFLKELSMADLWPLINVCDKFDFIDEMVKYLVETQNLKYVDMFVQRRNPLKTPKVVGALLDFNVNEDYIKNLILSVGALCPVEGLVEEVEKRNRLKIIQGWLEARSHENNQETALHNALGRIYIDANNNAESFLRSNNFYDAKVLGKYCENRDPLLSFVAYEKGGCDHELVALTNKNGMFKHQAKYLVKRQSTELWAEVLQESNEHRQAVVDMVVQVALPETKVPDEVTSTVRAFMDAEIPSALTDLLERIVLHGSSEFKSNKFLQNLLILTAIKAERGRVMDYINKLDQYECGEIAKIAEESELFEEAFTVHKKFKNNTQAVRILLERLKSLSRAVEYAERVNEPGVWSVVGKAQLTMGTPEEAIESFIKAQDASFAHDVINVASQKGAWGELIKFLQMARTQSKTKDGTIDTELVYAYAKGNRLAELEEFIAHPQAAQVQYIADRLFGEQLYSAARILYQTISNYARLAVTLVKLNEFYPAVDAATKANSVKTWKEVSAACVEAGEFKLAQMCAQNIMIHADELEDLIRFYEGKGYFEELISVLKAGLGLERAHMGMFTELGILYSKYKVDKLMEHIKLYGKRINATKLARVCLQYHHYAEARALHSLNDENDAAVRLMIDHFAVAWEHTVFKDTIARVSSPELLYQAIHFYLDTQPTLLVDLLSSIRARLDQERVVSELKRVDRVALARPYLESVAELNLKGVNEALCHLFIEENNHAALRDHIERYDHFDQLALADELKKHEQIEFRRVASLLFKKNKRWKQAVELSKLDKMYKDAIDTVSDSDDKDIAEDLLRFFSSNGLYECFSAMLYTCYDLVRPDLAIELAWRSKKLDFAMPFLVQVLKDTTDQIQTLNNQVQKLSTQQQQQGHPGHHGAQALAWH